MVCLHRKCSPTAGIFYIFRILSTCSALNSTKLSNVVELKQTVSKLEAINKTNQYEFSEFAVNSA